jgi:hypothetical protein
MVPMSVDARRFRIVVAGIDLGGEHDLLVRSHHFLERADRLFAADKQRHDHVRKHDDVAQWEDGIGTCLFRAV